MNRLHIPGEVYLMSSKEFVAESLNWAEGKNVLLVMNSSQDSRLHLDDWVRCLEARSLGVKRLQSTPSNPDVSDVAQALLLSGGTRPDLIIAIGGGSTIDMAKVVSALWYMKDHAFGRANVLDSIKSKQYLERASGIPILAVPTTAGTGSEVTKWATIWDKEGQAKLSIEAPWLCPVRACVVPELTVSMPARLTLSTGLDALCHAVEAYWAKASNPMVKELSKVAIRLIVRSLPSVLSDGRDLANREAMCLGSLFSGLAFSHTRTTACHSISYPLTLKWGVEHGIACALTLSRLLEVNLPALDRGDELLGALGISKPRELQEWLDTVSQGVTRLRLSSFGITANDVPGIVSGAFTTGRMDNNPVDLYPAEVGRILDLLV